MNAPKKIYVSIHSGIHHYEQKNDDDIEYISKDAVIEKAAEWLNNFYNGDTLSYLTNEDIEDFKNYMKGE